MGKIQTWLVATADDGKSAESMRVPCTYLLYQIGSKGNLQRVPYQGTAQGGLMGIFGGEGLGEADLTRLGRDILSECSKRGYRGVVLDFVPRREDVEKLTRLSNLLHQKGLHQYAPVNIAQLTPAAKIIVPSAISGGSYVEMLSQYVERYGAGNLCLELVRTCHDFTMPSYSPDGVALTAAEFQDIQRRYHPSPYFSPEMECKYFTYQGEEGKTHFVLYDDASTAARKIETAADLGYHAAFLLYGEWGREAREFMQ